jgi:hypothetical protein
MNCMVSIVCLMQMSFPGAMDAVLPHMSAHSVTVAAALRSVLSALASVAHTLEDAASNYQMAID